MSRKPTPSILDEMLEPGSPENTAQPPDLGELPPPSEKPAKKPAAKSKPKPKAQAAPPEPTPATEALVEQAEVAVEQAQAAMQSAQAAVAEAEAVIESVEAAVESSKPVRAELKVPGLEVEISFDAKSTPGVAESPPAEGGESEPGAAEAEPGAEAKKKKPPMVEVNLYPPRLVRKVVCAWLGLVSYTIEESIFIIHKLIERGEVTQKEGLAAINDITRQNKIPMSIYVGERPAPAEKTDDSTRA